MKNVSNIKVASGEKIDRHDVIRILQSAISVKAYKFCRRLAEHWLLVYPGDLQVDMMHGQALLQDGREDLGIPVLKRVVSTDPEYLPAWRLLAVGGKALKYSTTNNAWAQIHALGGSGAKISQLPVWSILSREARDAAKKGNLIKAQSLIQQAVKDDLDTPLPAIMNLQLNAESMNMVTRRSMIENYLARWPDTAIFLLLQSEVFSDNDMNGQAMNLLHQAVALDLDGQVSKKLWGSNHKHEEHYLQNMQISLPFPVPAPVATALGWNQLTEGVASIFDATPAKVTDFGKGQQSENKQLGINDIQEDFNLLAKQINQPLLSKTDGRFPKYIILTTKKGIENQFGSGALAAINGSLHKVVSSVKKLKNWDASLVYADDPVSVAELGIHPAKHDDAWSIKNFLKDLDNSLKKSGEMIGALLIVGGPEIVPFHHLPNPLDDSDVDVLSDNPYATIDENYFVPSWPVGRLPGAFGTDPGPLIRQIEKVAAHRTEILKNDPWWMRLLNKFFNQRMRTSFGYSAEVWRNASKSVFSSIGRPSHLELSPPIDKNSISNKFSKAVNLGYFNLHGIEDSPNWYGQRDIFNTPTGEDFPIAIRPIDVPSKGFAPQVVFTEACYGAYINGKTIPESMALTLLEAGTLTLIGSTTTSYGSMEPPLIAADLLAKLFWGYLQEGYTAGISLQRAKVLLAQEMHRRQGYLDGEDQKTLIQFVLYGDPLAQPFAIQNKSSKAMRIRSGSTHVRMVCDKQTEVPTLRENIPDAVVANVKNILKKSLPGMQNAKIAYSTEKIKCTGHNCPTHQFKSKSLPGIDPQRRVVILNKQIPYKDQIHNQFVRIKLNKDGSLAKMAISK